MWGLQTAAYHGRIAAYTFSEPSALKEVARAESRAPAWLEDITLDERFVLAVDEVPHAQLAVYDARLVRRGTAALGGDGAVSIAAVRTKDGAQVYVANYDSGSVSVVDLLPDGALGAAHVIRFTRSGTGPVSARQDKSYAHQVMPAPDGRHVYVCDLGADRIHILRVGAHAADAKHVDSVAVRDGSGPRHIAFDGDMAYVVMELSLEVQAYVRDASGMLVPQGLPVAACAGPGARTLAEIVVAPQRVYVSSRGDPVEDHIGVFCRAPSGALSHLQWHPSGGRVPRHFSASADGRYLAVANQGSETLAILDAERLAVLAQHRVGPINYAGFH